MPILAHLDDLAADLQPHFMDYAEDVSFGNRCVGSHHKVRATEGVEVRGVIRAIEGGIQQLTQKFRRARRVNLIDRVCRLGCRHVVRLRADATDTIRDQRHLLNGATHYKAFKAAQFGDLKIGIGYIALRIEKDLDLAVTFQTGDRVN